MDRPIDRPWQERFWDYVTKTEGCWIWTGDQYVLGYGRMSLFGKQDYAHRLSWKLHKGDLPKNKQIHHKCRNRLCVNPDHLGVITPSEHGAMHSVEGVAIRRKMRNPNARLEASNLK